MCIDREITKLMGWTEDKEFYIGEDNRVYFKYLDGFKFGELFAPHINIQDAWLVVEKAREFGYWFNLWNNGTVYYCEFGIESSAPLIRVSHDSAPLAICNAALAAIGENHEQR